MSQKILQKGLILLFFLNLFDVVLTITLIKFAQSNNIIAVEVNPLMNYFLSLGYLPFILFKIGIASLGISICWLYIKKLSRQYMMIGTVGVIVANAFYVSMLSLMITRVVIVIME